MKKQELKQLIKEEISNITNEGIAAEQDKHYETLSQLSSGKILGALASLMSIENFNNLMKKVGAKLNIKGY
jgi:hypothetical protein